MIKNESPQIAVIGLGEFGMALVKTLVEEGADIIAIDNNMDHLNKVKEITNNTICLDATDAEQLKAHGITEVDIAVISIGEHFEPVVLIAMELIHAGVKEVYGRANSDTQELILKQVGVTEIIHPERQVAERMGITLHKKGLEDLLDLGDGMSIFEVDVPKSMIGYKISELKLRNRYGINILTIKRLPKTGDQSDEKVYRSIGTPESTTTLQKDDKLIVFGKKENCLKMQELN